MRRLPWLSGFLGSGLSLVFWVVAPTTGGGIFHPGLESSYAFMIVLALAGMAGAVLSTAHHGWGAALMAVGVIPALAALLVPALLVIVGVLGTLMIDQDDQAHPVG